MLQALQWSWDVSGIFCLTDTGFCSENFKYALFLFFFRMDFPLKKSLCLSVCWSFFLSFCLSVCLSIRLCHRILFWNFEICTISLFSFGWWYTLMKNKHQISLYLSLKKMANIFQNGFSFKKNQSVCLSVVLSVCPFVPVTHPFHYVPIMASSWNVQEWLPMTEVMSMQKFKVRGQKSRLQRAKPKLAVSGP